MHPTLHSSLTALVKIGLTTLALLTVGDLNRSAHAQSVEPSCTGVQFAGLRRSLATTIAFQQGFFTEEGLNVCNNQVAGSSAIFNGLFAGDYDIISTAADNVVNRVVNSNEPVEIVAGVENGTSIALAVNTALGINSIADLRGRPIAVDSPTSGYVFALRRILAENGLFLENGDYSLQTVGGTSLRYQYLLAGETPDQEPVYATLLLYPFTILSESQPNIKVLEQFVDYVTPYQSSVLAVTKTAAAEQGDTLVAFLRAYIRASQFAADPANREIVLANIAAELDVPLDVAQRQLDAALDPITGENQNAQLDEQGLISVINLRQEFGGFNRLVDSAELARPSRGGLYNDQYWQAAISSLSPTTSVPEPTSMLGLLAFGVFGAGFLLQHKHH